MTDMKTRFPIYAALVLTSLLASCSKDFTSLADTDAPLEMKLQPVLAGETKASMQTSDLTEFWLQVENPQDPAYNYFTKVTKSGDAWNPADKMFWKNSSASVNYSAAYFKGHDFSQEEFADGVDLTVPADQSTQEKLNSADLLILKSTSTTYQATTNGALPVELQHGLAKVNIVIKLGRDFYDCAIGRTANPITDLVVSGVNMSFNFMPATAAVTAKSSLTDITPLYIEYKLTNEYADCNTATAIYEAIIVPQTIAVGALTITFKVKNGIYNWTNTSPITLSAGQTVNLPISATVAPPAPQYPKYQGHEYVELGDGLKWATCNVGANNPWDHGDYFAWGDPETYYYALTPELWMKDNKLDYSIYTGFGGYIMDFYKYASDEDHVTKYCDWEDDDHWSGTGSPDNRHVLEAIDDPATYNWGGTWRTPTFEEWHALTDNSQIEIRWEQNYNDWGVEGMVITSHIAGYEGNTLFLPKAGYFRAQDRNYSHSFYWSSTILNFREARCIEIRLLGLTMSTEERFWGIPVRPVSN